MTLYTHDDNIIVIDLRPQHVGPFRNLETKDLKIWQEGLPLTYNLINGPVLRLVTNERLRPNTKIEALWDTLISLDNSDQAVEPFSARVENIVVPTQSVEMEPHKENELLPWLKSKNILDMIQIPQGSLFFAPNTKYYGYDSKGLWWSGAPSVRTIPNIFRLWSESSDAFAEYNIITKERPLQDGEIITATFEISAASDVNYQIELSDGVDTNGIAASGRSGNWDWKSLTFASTTSRHLDLRVKMLEAEPRLRETLAPFQCLDIRSIIVDSNRRGPVYRFQNNLAGWQGSQWINLVEYEYDSVCLGRNPRLATWGRLGEFPRLALALLTETQISIVDSISGKVWWSSDLLKNNILSQTVAKDSSLCKFQYKNLDWTDSTLLVHGVFESLDPLQHGRKFTLMLNFGSDRAFVLSENPAVLTIPQTHVQILEPVTNALVSQDTTIKFRALAHTMDPYDGPYEYTWTFDDGSVQISDTAYHKFTTPGAHTTMVSAVNLITGLNATAAVLVNLTLPIEGRIVFTIPSPLWKIQGIQDSSALLKQFNVTYQVLPDSRLTDYLNKFEALFSASFQFPENKNTLTKYQIVAVATNPQLSPSALILNSFELFPSSIDVSHTVDPTFNSLQITADSNFSYPAASPATLDQLELVADVPFALSESAPVLTSIRLKSFSVG